jgi:aminoglycoside phosphotransferase (APT) family kinase protein
MTLNAPITEIDPVDVLRSAGWDAPEECARIEGGWDTYIWRFRTSDGKVHGLRVYRLGEGRDTEGAFQRESRALGLLCHFGIPCPDVEASGTYRDMPFFVLSWLPGTPLITVLEKQPWKLWRLGFEFGRLQARLHRLPCADTLRFESDRQWIETADDPEIHAAMEGRVNSTAFCHFDFHPINVMCHEGRLTGVLDFTFSGKADARADLGRTNALLVAAPIPPSPKKPVLQYLRGQFAASWKRGYVAEAGNMPLEPLFEAWGGATFYHNIKEAVADGRGWGTPADIEKMRLYVEDRKRAAGITS